MSRLARKTEAPTLAPTMETQNMAAALARVGESSGHLTDARRVLETGIAALERALASEREARADEAAEAKTAAEAAARDHAKALADLQADHKKQVAALKRALDQVTASHDSIQEKLSSVVGTIGGSHKKSTADILRACGIDPALQD